MVKINGSARMRGYRNQLKGAVNKAGFGFHVKLDMKTAEAILDMCDQLIRIEKEHEAPEDER
jgi:hypothetical protein